VIRYIKGFSYFVTSITAPIASGRSKIAGWDSHPLENAAFARRTPQIALHFIQPERQLFLKGVIDVKNTATRWLPFNVPTHSNWTTLMSLRERLTQTS